MADVYRQPAQLSRQTSGIRTWRLSSRASIPPCLMGTTGNAVLPAQGGERQSWVQISARRPVIRLFLAVVPRPYRQKPEQQLNYDCYLPHPFQAITINLLKPTGYVMQQQFNIQQLYVLPTLYLCVLYLSENKQRLVPLIS